MPRTPRGSLVLFAEDWCPPEALGSEFRSCYRLLVSLPTRRCSATLHCLAVLLSTVCCGVAHRNSDAGDRDGHRDQDAGVFDCTATCTSVAVQAEVHSASGNAADLFAVIQPTGGSFASVLVRVALDSGMITTIIDLQSASPERSSLLLDEDVLYWTDSQDNDGSVSRIVPASMEASVIADTQARPSAATANSTSIYWGVHGGVMRYDKSTMLVTRIHSFEPTDRVPWISANDSEMLYRAGTHIYRLELVDGVTAGTRTELVQTIRPIGLLTDRFYYQVPSNLSTSGDDEIMSMPSSGGTASLQAQEEEISAPTLLPGGDLLWFGYANNSVTLVRQDSAGNQTTQSLRGSLGGSVRWVSTQGSTLIWLADTVLTLLGAEHCECDS